MVIGKEKTDITITLTQESGNPELFVKRCKITEDFNEDEDCVFV